MLGILLVFQMMVAGVVSAAAPRSCPVDTLDLHARPTGRNIALLVDNFLTSRNHRTRANYAPIIQRSMRLVEASHRTDENAAERKAGGDVYPVVIHRLGFVASSWQQDKHQQMSRFLKTLVGDVYYIHPIDFSTPSITAQLRPVLFKIKLEAAARDAGLSVSSYSGEAIPAGKFLAVEGYGKKFVVDFAEADPGGGEREWKKGRKRVPARSHRVRGAARLRGATRLRTVTRAARQDPTHAANLQRLSALQRSHPGIVLNPHAILVAVQQGGAGASAGTLATTFFDQCQLDWVAPRSAFVPPSVLSYKEALVQFDAGEIHVPVS